jgi:hypothetical protein
MNSIKVKKASGKLEPFSEAKVRRSLQRAGARPEIIDQIIIQLAPKLYDGVSTKFIYQQVFNLLNQLQEHQAYRYSLKQALMQLGPSGYPFEKFIARLLDFQGYQTQSPVIVQGQCIKHEVDVVAEKDKQKYLIECKFHNRPGIKTDVQVALYVQARFEDIAGFNQAWLVTNTKLTQSAITYGQCKNIKLLAWRYPQENGLETMIETAQLHPLTCLGFLTSQEKQILFDHKLVLCQDLKKTESKLLESWGFDPAKITQIKQVIDSIFPA